MKQTVCYAIPKQVGRDQYNVYLTDSNEQWRAIFSKKEIEKRIKNINQTMSNNFSIEIAVSEMDFVHVVLDEKQRLMGYSFPPEKKEDYASILCLKLMIQKQKEYISSNETSWRTYPWIGKLVCIEGVFQWNEEKQDYIMKKTSC